MDLKHPAPEGADRKEMSPLSVSNKKLGTGFERKFAQFLSSNGFWVHLLTQNNSGQPADVLAARKGQPFLIDCKVCQNGIFKIDRIEQNQETAMEHWSRCGNGEGWFALELPDKKVIMVDYDTMMCKALYKTVLSQSEIIESGYLLEKWVNLWM